MKFSGQTLPYFLTHLFNSPTFPVFLSHPSSPSFLTNHWHEIISKSHLWNSHNVPSTTSHWAWGQTKFHLNSPRPSLTDFYEHSFGPNIKASVLDSVLERDKPERKLKRERGEMRSPPLLVQIWGKWKREEQNKKQEDQVCVWDRERVSKNLKFHSICVIC